MHIEYKKSGCILTLTKEDVHTFGDDLTCPVCLSPLIPPFYMCETNKKLFCARCELKEGTLNPIDAICKYQLTVEGHRHFKIIRVRKEGEDNNGKKVDEN